MCILGIAFLFESTAWFMQSRSTVAQMLSYFDHIYSLRNNILPVGAIYFDVKKAFDSVIHKLLLENLEKYVLDINFLTFMDSSLFNRGHCVKLDSPFYSGNLWCYPRQCTWALTLHSTSTLKAATALFIVTT